MRITVLDPSRYTNSPWKNGGGVTVDIAEERLPGSMPGSWEGLVWRFGRTTISTPAPFSDMAGFVRCQVVISGSGLILDTPDGEVDLRRPFVPARYRGEAPISSRLENGPVAVVNLIADRALASISLYVLNAGARFDLTSGISILHAASGPVELDLDGQRYLLDADHALQLDVRSAQLIGLQGLVLVASIHTP